ncbi:hybrid sensor histidine kinase/response regulator [Fulvivirgaceae bacterium BMA10]|uniref:histidine kinase n=1 Tax=Splendidivirga corallicola TaxID=3051826 RepID=A0ABT8KLY2_9BACT|nr:hybrid sensor histidine kinase/response regulator [Fulvivirgaceae bacterium BMA10]
MKKYNILYVDDEQNNIIVFKNAFFRHYNIYTALSGEEGLKIINENEIHLVITDQKMAGMSGVEFLEKIVNTHPETVRMILTAYSDIDFIMRAINKCGIYQYILKPWDSRELKLIIDNALKSYQLKRNNEQLIDDLKKANESLEEKVRVRTKKLNQNNELLQKTNEIKDKLFTIISHDLKIPMASLNVLMEVLVQSKDNIPKEAFEKYSLKVQSYIQNVMDLLDNLLNWSLSQLGDKKIEITEINLKEIIDHNIKLFHINATQKNINLKVPETLEGIMIQGDINMMNLIFRNLLSNAIKFTPKKGEVSIGVNKERKLVKVSITDTGTGIPDDILAKLFNATYFNSNRGTAHERGTGLGLKLCKEFIEKQNGELNIETKLNEGSTFSFTIPKA